MSSRVRPIWVASALVALAAVAGIGMAAYLSGAAERAAREAIVAYDNALVRAVADLDIAPIETVAGPREQQRVANYLVLLDGRGVTLDARLLDFEVLELVSGDPTVTVTVRERWSYRERDAASGAYKGDEVTEEQTLRYTLLPDSGEDGLLVYLAEVIEGAGTQ